MDVDNSFEENIYIRPTRDEYAFKLFTNSETFGYIGNINMRCYDIPPIRLEYIRKRYCIYGRIRNWDIKEPLAIFETKIPGEMIVDVDTNESFLHVNGFTFGLYSRLYEDENGLYMIEIMVDNKKCIDNISGVFSLQLIADVKIIPGDSSKPYWPQRTVRYYKSSLSDIFEV